MNQTQETGKNILAISITWIGFKLQASWHPEHKQILKEVFEEKKLEEFSPVTLPNKLSIKSVSPYVREYAMTINGEPICLNEYAAKIVGET